MRPPSAGADGSVCMLRHPLCRGDNPQPPRTRLYDDPKPSFLPLTDMDKDLVVDSPGFRLQPQSRSNDPSVGFVPFRWLASQREFGVEERSHGLEVFRRGKGPSMPRKIGFRPIDLDGAQKSLSSVEPERHRDFPLQRFRTLRISCRAGQLTLNPGTP